MALFSFDLKLTEKSKSSQIYFIFDRNILIFKYPILINLAVNLCQILELQAYTVYTYIYMRALKKLFLC